jgi:glutamate---cysteine ligase / carboxylate-amine ligase
MSPVLRLFEGYGIELEYAIVDRDDLRVRPLCAELLEALALAADPGATHDETDEVSLGDVACSNELAAHVVELKTDGPTPDIERSLPAFESAITRVDRVLEQHGAMLLPSAMHPTMDPSTELRLWSRGQRSVYAAYDRIFGCQGHGWANLQSCHLNLPFCGDDELDRLHAAVRAVLALLPALAASSPVVHGRLTGALDQRLVFYASNQRRLPSIIGRIVPESIRSMAEYEATILAPMYREIAPLDPQGVLAHEWLNSRGAIARFDRNAIEIRVLDVQEAPVADLAIARLVSQTLQALVLERWVELDTLRGLDTDALRAVFDHTVQRADRALVTDAELLRVFGFSATPIEAGEIWHALAATLSPASAIPGPLDEALRVITQQGCLARRICDALGPDPSEARVKEIYRELSQCLVQGRSFQAGRSP